MELKNRIAVVTGASKGMGAATARVLYREGASVALLDRDVSGSKLAAAFGRRGMFVRCDVSNGSQVARAFGTIRRRFGGVDCVSGKRQGRVHHRPVCPD